MKFYAQMFYDGDGILINKEEAAKYYKMGALKHDYNSAVLYVNMLYSSDGVDEDKKTAAEFYKMSADNGESTAMTKYGEMLIYGDGNDVNLDEGNRYLKMAKEEDINLQRDICLYLAELLSYSNSIYYNKTTHFIQQFSFFL